MKLRNILLCFCLSMVAACPDPGLEPIAYCHEHLASPSGSDVCSVQYVACKDSFACSWRVDCSRDGTGKTTCACRAEAPAGVECHIGATWVEEDLCGAVSQGDRVAVRDIAIRKCIKMTPEDIDFSRVK